MEIDLTTPALLFSAISLIMLAYTNRFLSYAQLVRTLKDQYRENHSAVTAAQIANLRKRLYLTRAMQVTGIGSLLLCVVSMFLMYIQFYLISVYIFGLALVLLIISLGISVREIYISGAQLDEQVQHLVHHLVAGFCLHTKGRQLAGLPFHMVISLPEQFLVGGAALEPGQHTAGHYTLPHLPHTECSELFAQRSGVRFERANY